MLETCPSHARAKLLKGASTHPGLPGMFKAPLFFFSSMAEAGELTSQLSSYFLRGHEQFCGKLGPWQLRQDCPRNPALTTHRSFLSWVSEAQAQADMDRAHRRGS